MTKYQPPIAQRAALTIKNLHKRLSVTEQRTATNSVQGNVSRARITSLQASMGTVPAGTTLQGQIGTVPTGKTLQSQVSDIYSRIGDTGDTGSQGLENHVSQFLAALTVMSTPANFPLSDLPSGGTLNSNERNIINQCIDVVNNLVTKLNTNGFMQ